jgi:hypothetical protein
MPRGSKPGERRGGHRRATPNKRTVLTDRIVAVASANALTSCDALVARLVKDQKLPASTRVAIARTWFAPARSCAAKGRSKKGDAATAPGSQATGRPAPLKSDGGAANGTALSATAALPAASPTTNSPFVAATVKNALSRSALASSRGYRIAPCYRQSRQRQSVLTPEARWGSRKITLAAAAQSSSWLSWLSWSLPARRQRARVGPPI